MGFDIRSLKSSGVAMVSFLRARTEIELEMVSTSCGIWSLLLAEEGRLLMVCSLSEEEMKTVDMNIDRCCHG